MHSSQKQILRLVAGLAYVLMACCDGRAYGAEAPREKTVVTPYAHLRFSQMDAPVISTRFLTAGASVFTVYFVDDTHLLLSFGARTLVRRREEAKASDEDRNVTVELVELPSGSVVAKAEWHLWDYARYLWKVSPGRFVVRMGDNLSLMTPGDVPLPGKDAFQRVALPHQKGRPIAVNASPSGDLITVITELPAKEHKGPVVVMGDATENRPKPEYAFDFYRIKDLSRPEGHSVLEVTGVGAVKSPIPIALAASRDGYLWSDEKARNLWSVGFYGFGGKTMDVGSVLSSCMPRMQLVSLYQYLAISCNGTDTSPKLMAMGMDGHETWEEAFDRFGQAPAFAVSPEAGRFAMSRVHDTESAGNYGARVTGTAEEIRVYQTESGDLLAKVKATPLFITPENFDLSPDGLTLVVVNGDGLDLYRLPEPSKRDRKDMEEAMQFQPPAVGDAPVTLSHIARAAERATVAEAVPASTTTQAEQAMPVTAERGNEGDTVASTGPRKRPSLLNPGEKPEFEDKSAQPR
ncbi:MAG: hypothetical protein PW735_01760 [Acidobacteriaceae bacterium]|nr:hypothetical protein [Acidobacteriaceae bacterium]